MPTDAVRRPLELMVYFAPRGLIERPTEFLLKLSRRPEDFNDGPPSGGAEK